MTLSAATRRCLMRQELHPAHTETLTIGCRGWPLPPGAEFSRWCAELSVDIAGELLYNIDRLMSGNDLNVVDWKGLLV